MQKLLIVLIIILSLFSISGLARHVSGHYTYATITEPSSDGVWKGSSFNVRAEFEDTYGMLGQTQCRVDVYSWINNDWQRTKGNVIYCSGSTYADYVTVSVGSSGDCRTEGQNKCLIVAETTYSDDIRDEIEISIDYNPPRTTINPSGYSWTGNDVTFTLSCSDGNGRGCRENHFEVVRMNGAIDVSHTVGDSYTISCPYGSECQRRVYYHSVDNMGRENSQESTVFQIDKKAPTPDPASISYLYLGPRGASVDATQASDASGTVNYHFSGPTEPYVNGRYASFNGLMPDTEYCFGVYYSDRFGNSGQGGSRCGYTRLEQPTIRSIDPLSPSSVYVIINPNGNPSHVSYTVRYDTPGVPAEEVNFGTSTEGVIDNLLPNKQYTFRVSARGQYSSVGYSSPWYKYTLANPVDGLSISSQFNITQERLLSGAVVDDLISQSPIQLCSTVPVTVEQDGTVNYKLGIEISSYGIDLCQEGSIETGIDLGDIPIETPCAPYNAAIDNENGQITLYNRKYKIGYVGDQPTPEECSEETVSIPVVEKCDSVYLRDDGSLGYNLGSRIYINGTMYGDCMSGTTPAAFPYETPCFPYVVESLSSESISIGFYRAKINSIQDHEFERCYSLSPISGNEQMYTFEDGRIPDHWITYTYNHPRGLISRYPLYDDEIVDSCIRQEGDWIGTLISYVTGQKDKTTQPGWIISNDGHDSSYSIKSNTVRDFQSSILYIPIIVDRTSVVEFDYKSIGNEHISSDHFNGWNAPNDKIKVQINGWPHSYMGTFSFQTPYNIFNAKYLEATFYADTKLPPSSTWAHFDSGSFVITESEYSYNPYMNLNPGFNVITLELTRGQDGSCDDNVNIWIDNLRIRPV